MNPEQFKQHIEKMERHENIFWEEGGGEDEINKKLREVLVKLELITAPCFEEPMSTYAWLTRRLGRGGA